MPICSYVVLPDPGAAPQVARQLAAIPGCEVTAAGNRDLLILVTETSGEAAEQALLASLAQLGGIRSMSLTFGELAR